MSGTFILGLLSLWHRSTAFESSSIEWFCYPGSEIGSGIGYADPDLGDGSLQRGSAIPFPRSAPRPNRLTDRPISLDLSENSGGRFEYLVEGGFNKKEAQRTRLQRFAQETLSLTGGRAYDSLSPAYKPQAVVKFLIFSHLWSARCPCRTSRLDGPL